MRASDRNSQGRRGQFIARRNAFEANDLEASKPDLNGARPGEAKKSGINMELDTTYGSIPNKLRPCRVYANEVLV
jgi:hypothetical protein